ncbi:MAG TPA: aldo/keto reductase [Kofleriaceae bacterium]|nr:aldo/keto reductase [Kofleriaceae bacterium]
MSTFAIGGDLVVHRLGFGAMRITGRGIWGPPASMRDAKATLGKLAELGVDFIDTAESYGPHISEDIIREVLYPYKGFAIATKGGLERPGPNQWLANGRPGYLRDCVEGSLKRLGVERIDLWQLHRIDSGVPRAEQFGAIAEMQQQGLIRHVGLSEVSAGDIDDASKYFKVTTVQNEYNIADRKSEAVLKRCEQGNIGFIPWAPLQRGGLAGDKLDAIAKQHGATPNQIALAWLLKRSPVMLPIPGTGNPEHLVENCGAAKIELSDADFAAIGH